MARNIDVRKITSPSAIFSLMIMLIVYGWFLYQFYWSLFNNTDILFPLKFEQDSESIILHNADFLEQTFISPRENLEDLLIVYDNDRSNIGEGDYLIIDIVDERQISKKAIITAEMLKDTKQIRLNVNSGGPSGEKMVVRLQYNSQSSSSEMRFPISYSKTLENPPILARLNTNKGRSRGFLLLSPTYEESKQLLKGDVFDYRFELTKLAETVLSGRPVWLQWLMVLSFVAMNVLSVSFLTIVFEMVFRNQRKSRQFYALLVFAILWLLVVLFV